MKVEILALGGLGGWKFDDAGVGMAWDGVVCARLPSARRGCRESCPVWGKLWGGGELEEMWLRSS